MSLNQSNIFAFEYLLTIEKNHKFNDIKRFNNNIFNILQKNGIQSFFCKGDTISVENNSITFNLFSKDSIFIENKEQNNINEENTLNESKYSNEKNNSSKYFPFLSKSKNFINIKFINTSGFSTEVSIEDDKTIKDLIKAFFEKINRIDLFGCPKLSFVNDGYILNSDSIELIKDLYGEDNVKTILVVDPDDMI